MNFIDEFRDPHKAKGLLAAIDMLAARNPLCAVRPLQLMEVCGGHTHSIFKYGIERMLGERIELVHRAEDRMIFARGALHAAAWARGQKPGLYSMADVLGLKDF